MADVIGVYTIVHVNSGTVYVGSSKNVYIRWRAHLSALRQNRHWNAYLQAAWIKYGEGAFLFQVVEKIPAVDLLITREQCWLDSLRERGPVYNLCPVVGSMRGYKHTDATRRKMRGRFVSSEARCAVAEANRSRIWTDESRRKCGLSWVGRRHTEETKKKMAAAHRGVTHSVETKLKLSKDYPALVNEQLGIREPAGRNISAFSRRYDLDASQVCKVIKGKRRSHKGWRLADV